MRHYFYHHEAKRNATLCALLAIVLIIVAPLISVAVQKNAVSGMHHSMAMMYQYHAASEPMMMETHHAGHKPLMMPGDSGEACGYCVLLAHMPAALLAQIAPIAVLLLRQRLRAPPPAPRTWYFSPRRYPETRAPPGLSAFLC